MNQTFTLTIDRLGINGEGIGRLDGLTVFVEGALPGEQVDVRLYEKRKTYARAEIVKILNSSPNRTNAPCALYGKCGGCQLMHLQYEQQLIAKQQRVLDALIRIGKLDAIEVLPCIPSPAPLSYRNKIQLPSSSNATIKFGLYAHNSHDLVEIESCKIHCQLGDEVFQKVEKILKTYEISSDLLKTLLIKTAYFTNQVLVVLVTQESQHQKLTCAAEQILKEIPQVKGVVQNINPSSNNCVLGKTFRTLAGVGFIEEKLCDLYFKVSPASFFQVNPLQAQNLYEKALEFADLKGDERVLDAYCGVGTLSLILAKKAKEVIGVECVFDAVEDAKYNALRNGCTNAQFFCAMAEDFVKSLSNIDVALLNPPRKGCEKSFLEALSLLKPERIIYISCDPATLARDLSLLQQSGYEITYVQPFDMFPQTAHVETLVQMRLKKTPKMQSPMASQLTFSL